MIRLPKEMDAQIGRIDQALRIPGVAGAVSDFLDHAIKDAAERASKAAEAALFDDKAKASALMYRGKLETLNEIRSFLDRFTKT